MAHALRDISEVLTRPGLRRFVATHVGTGIAEMRRSFSKALLTATLARLVRARTPDGLVPGGSGVRAMALAPAGTMVDDFNFVETDRMVHVLNAPSPAATASLAIGKEWRRVLWRAWSDIYNYLFSGLRPHCTLAKEPA